MSACLLDALTRRKANILVLDFAVVAVVDRRTMKKMTMMTMT